ncbi:hypothetical protein IQ265_01445 [Nodosilinea sp. LEGE 06152]|uniref:hypothetical protein n=1 Tax=Nodosilinea sp. LEGE 06152 TaxID=2777966 RepID=UPI0018809C6E|nr:hypothetical protein [Nodosilinea sp. LEGE 06152]MBE9155509.1 hypothetical protein [Nodosilinea sp. LEGE 06152]
MRVWALASCSGLLALAACSAEKTSPPDLGTAPPESDDAAEVNAQPGLRATSSSPMARPELRPRQGGLDRARFSPRSSQASPVVSRSSGAGQTLPQADQLRARLQRLRTQHGSRLSSNTPLATAPLPAALTSTPPRPVPAAEQPLETRSEALPTPPSDVGVTALPTLSQPNVARPNVAAPELGLSSTASTAIDLGPVASARPTDSYSVAPARHQGYSARSQQPAPTITTAAAGVPEGLTARLHGATSQAITLASPADAPAAVAAQPSPASPSPVAPSPAAPLPAAPLATTAGEVAPVSAAADSEPATAHQSSATPALTLTPPQVEASAPTTLTHHNQGRTAQPETAIREAIPLGVAPLGRSAATAPPESLPLNPGTPRLTPLRPAAVTSSDAALTVPRAAAPQGLGAQPPAIQASEAPVSEAQILEAQTTSASFSAHQGQSQPESLSLNPQPEASSKDLPLAYCFQASDRPLNPEAQTGTDPQSAGQQLDQLSMLIGAGSADAALRPGERLSKAEPAAACLEANGVAAEPAADDSRSAPPLN